MTNASSAGPGGGRQLPMSRRRLVTVALVVGVVGVVGVAVAVVQHWASVSLPGPASSTLAALDPGRDRSPPSAGAPPTSSPVLADGLRGRPDSADGRVSSPRPAPAAASTGNAAAASTTARPPTLAGSAVEDLNPWLLVDPEAEIATARAALRLYIYNFDGLLPRHPFEDIDCSKTMNAQYRMESLLLDAFTKYAKVVTDPAEADLFVVPHNGTCYGVNNIKLSKIASVHGAGHNMSAYYFEPLLRVVVERFPYYNASGGRDHVYVFTFDRAVALFSQYVYNVTLPGIRIQSYGVDTTHPSMATKAADPWSAGRTLSRPSDIVIPQPVRLPLADRDHTQPAGDRGRLAIFVGTIEDKYGYSEGVRVGLLRAYANDTLLGPAPDRIAILRGNVGPVYMDILANSSFGLCPSGWTPWTARLWDVLSQAAIPAIIADGVVEPFESYINWRAISVKVANANVGAVKACLLAARASPSLSLKQQALMEVAPYLHWTVSPTRSWGKSIGLIILSLCERTGKCAPKRRYVAPPLAWDEFCI